MGGDEALLGAVVEVALEALALGVRGGDQAGARLQQSFAGVGAGDGEACELGELGEAILGVVGQVLALEGREHQRAPDGVLDDDRRGGALAQAGRLHDVAHGAARGGVFVVAGGQAGLADERQRTAAAQRELGAGGQRGRRAPAAGDRRAALAEAHDRRRAHAANVCGLLGDRCEHVAGLAAAGDEHGDFAQSRLDHRERL